MQFGEQQLEAYLIAYNKFQADMSVVEDLEESLHNMQENLKNKQQQLEQSIRDRNFTEKQKIELIKKLVEEWYIEQNEIDIKLSKR